MLYLIGTPIGNLDDLSLRAAQILVSIPVLLAEDTRKAQVILEKAEKMMGKKRIENQKVISYYLEVEFERLPYSIELLKNGSDLALISEAGMPLISDPGYLLVHEARKRNIHVTVIPGPSSVDTALVASGLKFDHFYFIGFLPKKTNEKLKLFNKLRAVANIMTHEEVVFVAFESPDRVCKTLEELYASFPAVRLVLCRELTKKFEEVILQPTPKSYKGEQVILISLSK